MARLMSVFYSFLSSLHASNDNFLYTKFLVTFVFGDNCHGSLTVLA